MADVTFDENGLAEQDGNVLVYHYDNDGYYTSSETLFRKKGTGLPARTTLEAPSVPYPQNRYPIFVNGGWGWVPDYRGTLVYNLQTKQSRLIRDLGPIPANETTEKPDQANDVWNAQDQKWEANTAEEKQRRDQVVGQAWDQLNHDMITLAILGKTPGPQMTQYARDLYKLYQEIERPDYLPKMPEDFLG